jgi:hypothetical protein
VESDLLCFLLRESLYGNRARQVRAIGVGGCRHEVLVASMHSRLHYTNSTQAASSLRLILMSATLESSIFIDYFTPAHRQATVPRLHVGARSPFKVPGPTSVCVYPPVCAAGRPRP